MLSRVAASFYWLSRYIERSDGMLRMLKINYASSQDAVQEFTWEPVIRILQPVVFVSSSACDKSVAVAEETEGSRV